MLCQIILRKHLIFDMIFNCGVGPRITPYIIRDSQIRANIGQQSRPSPLTSLNCELIGI